MYHMKAKLVVLAEELNYRSFLFPRKHTGLNLPYWQE
jgi:hypothetical protein